jgi:hypothetical protein
VSKVYLPVDPRIAKIALRRRCAAVPKRELGVCDPVDETATDGAELLAAQQLTIACCGRGLDVAA